MEKKEKIVTERNIKAYFKAHPHLKRRLTEDEIIKIKVDFIHAIMPEKIFKSKSEIKEKLEKYRDLFAIRNKTERELVNSMIMIASNIPDELIEKKEKEKEKLNPELKYSCKKCNQTLENKDHQTLRIRSEWRSGNIVVLREKHLGWGQFQCFNGDCVDFNVPKEVYELL